MVKLSVRSTPHSLIKDYTPTHKMLNLLLRLKVLTWNQAFDIYNYWFVKYD
jgi:hypothetical protein